MNADKVEYAGKDLEAMDFAVRYHNWILEVFRPYLGKRIVEVGAGTGSFSELLLETQPESLTLVEPSEMFERLELAMGSRNGVSRPRLHNNIFRNVAAEIKDEQRPDSIIYVNVLEHIDDDELELEVVHDTLAQGGRLFIFVPANRFLFSKFDRNIGHYRRYGKKELHQKLDAAGFRLVKSRWFDLPGVLPWLIKYRFMRSTTMESGAVQAYDRYIVPAIRPIENLINPPIGKNLIVIAEKA